MTADDRAAFCIASSACSGRRESWGCVLLLQLRRQRLLGIAACRFDPRCPRPRALQENQHGRSVPVANFSTRITSPGATRYCFPPARITAYIRLPPTKFRKNQPTKSGPRAHGRNLACAEFFCLLCFPPRRFSSQGRRPQNGSASTGKLNYFTCVSEIGQTERARVSVRFCLTGILHSDTAQLTSWCAREVSTADSHRQDTALECRIARDQ